MLKKIVLLSITFLLSQHSFGQKGQVQIARNAVGKLQGTYTNPALKAKTTGFINDGLKAIDLAKDNRKTGKWSETWSLKAYLHACNALLNANNDIGEKQFNLAVSALDTAKKLDKDPINSNLIHATVNNIMIWKLDKGNRAFDEKDFPSAYSILKEVSDYNEKDTSTAINVAIAAKNIQKDEISLKYLLRAKTNGVKDPAVFQQIAKFYSLKFEPEAALQILREGMKLNPENSVLKKDFINILLDNNRFKDALHALEADPTMLRNDERLFFIDGLLNQLENRFSAAETAYKRSIIINPNNFDALYQLGLVYIDMAKKSASKSDENFKKAMTNAQVALSRAFTIKPNDRSTILLLIELYKVNNDLERARELQRGLREF